MDITKKQQRSLDMFMDKHKKWHEHFKQDHKNSITSQLYKLIWYSGVFRVINQSRIYTTLPDGSNASNGMTHDFINNCFFEYQLISIRRLLDKDRDKTTFSLYALVRDMEENHHLITRLNYFEVWDFEYDVDQIQRKYEEYEHQQLKAGNNTFFIPRNLDWEICEEYHAIFDALSNTKSNKRKPSDFVQKDFFTTLRNKLDQLDDIVTHTNKFVAHLEKPVDGPNSDVDTINITLGKIWYAHEVICKIATLLAKTFFEAGGGFLGTTQFDQFENIEKPFVEDENIPKLKQVWHEYFKQTESWAYIDIDNYDEYLS